MTVNPESPEGRLRAAGISGPLSAAYDVLHDAGVADLARVALIVWAEEDGHDPETVARHLVKSNRAWLSSRAVPP